MDPGTMGIEFCDESEFLGLEAFLVDRIYEFNARATGHADGRLLGARLRDEAGEVIAAFNGHTWGGCCVIAHLWVHESHRGLGLGRSLLQAAEAEALGRGCEQVILSTHTFQAPGFYERLGYAKQAVVRNHPRGHGSFVYTKALKARKGDRVMIGQGQFRFSYFTRKFEETVAFYRDDLKLPVVESWYRDEDDRGALFAAASGIIEVVLRPENPAAFHGWDDRPPQGAFMAIEVRDVEQAYRRATERRLPIREALADQPWGHRSFCIVEPNGLVIYLYSEP